MVVINGVDIHELGVPMDVLELIKVVVSGIVLAFDGIVELLF